MRSGKYSVAQSILDYAVIISVVAAALVVMNTYLQRAVKSNLKTIEAQVNASVTSQPESAGVSSNSSSGSSSSNSEGGAGEYRDGFDIGR